MESIMCHTCSGSHFEEDLKESRINYSLSLFFPFLVRRGRGKKKGFVILKSHCSFPIRLQSVFRSEHVRLKSPPLVIPALFFNEKESLGLECGRHDKTELLRRTGTVSFISRQHMTLALAHRRQLSDIDSIDMRLLQNYTF